MAIGAIRAFRDKGLSVPAHISVASCDHFSSGEYFIPRITGIARDTYLLGRLLIDTLLQNIRGTREDSSIDFSTRLWEGESCQGF